MSARACVHVRVSNREAIERERERESERRERERERVTARLVPNGNLRTRQQHFSNTLDSLSKSTYKSSRALQPRATCTHFGNTLATQCAHFGNTLATQCMTTKANGYPMDYFFFREREREVYLYTHRLTKYIYIHTDSHTHTNKTRNMHHVSTHIHRDTQKHTQKHRLP